MDNNGFVWEKDNSLPVRFYLLLIFLFIFTSIKSQLPGSSITLNDQPTDFNVIPKNPQATELGRFQNQGINGATGTPIINILIYTIEEDGVSIPISLNYNATGIKTTDLSSEVGLKWTLHAGGSVSRMIKGLPDDDTYGWINYDNSSLYSRWTNNAACNQENFMRIADNQEDILPDLFSYNIGEYQNTFIFNKNKQIHKTIRDNIIIKYNQGNRFDNFTLTDIYGTQYYFGDYFGRTKVENSVRKGGASTVNSPRSGEGINEWKLKTITTKNNKTINFTYEAYSLSYNLTNSEVTRIRLSPSIKRTYSIFTSFYEMTAQLISKIETNKCRVDFIYEIDNNADIWKKKLTCIKITDKLTNSVSSYKFEYLLYPVINQLKLTKIKEIAEDGVLIGKVWEFNYDPGQRPIINTKDFDFFGYYNAKGNSGYVPLAYNNGSFSVQNSRDINNLSIHNGVLKEIIYPTKGKTIFYYEANSEMMSSGKIKYAPGLRVRRIDDVDAQDIILSKEYTYSGLTGDIQIDDENKYNQFYKHSETQGYSIVLYSEKRNLLDVTSGYSYALIETKHLKDNAILFREKNCYSPFNLNNIQHPKLSKTEYLDKQNNLQKKIIFSYPNPYFLYNIKGWRLNSTIKNNTLEYCDGSSYYVDDYYTGIFMDYNNSSYSSLLLDKKSIIEYHDGDSIKTSIHYYNNPNTLLLEWKLLESSVANKSYRETYTYPSSDLYNNLYIKNIVGFPVFVKNVIVEESTIPKGPIGGGFLNELNSQEKIINYQKWDYDDLGNKTAYYDFIDDSVQNYLKLKNQYTYNQHNNIIEITQRGNLVRSYLWSYKNEFPIVEIISAASYSTIKEILGEYNISNFANKMNPSIDEIKAFLAPLSNNINTQDAMITIYTYKPLVGMTSTTDPRGVTTSYEYDGFNRLQFIKDKDGKMIQTYDYRYKQ